MQERIFLVGFVLVLIWSSSDAVAGETPGAAQDQAARDESAQMASARQTELQAIAGEFGDHSDVGHGGAIQRLVHLASTYPVMPPRVRDLLIRATADSKPELARLAERALYVLESRGQGRDLEPEVPERELIARSRRLDFERATASLAAGAADAGGRLGAVQTLVHLASLGPAAPALADEAIEWLRRLESDADPDVARLAGQAVASREDPSRERPYRESPYREGTARASAFARPAAPARRPTGSRSPEATERFAALAHERPTARLAALELILESALNDDRRDDPEVIAAFVGLLGDPDSRVAYRAGNALLALAGDPDALADVYVGEPEP